MDDGTGLYVHHRAGEQNQSADQSPQDHCAGGGRRHPADQSSQPTQVCRVFRKSVIIAAELASGMLLSDERAGLGRLHGDSANNREGAGRYRKLASPSRAVPDDISGAAAGSDGAASRARRSSGYTVTSRRAAVIVGLPRFPIP
jgi:hypothetical protein